MYRENLFRVGFAHADSGMESRQQEQRISLRKSAITEVERRVGIYLDQNLDLKNNLNCSKI